MREVVAAYDTFSSVVWYQRFGGTYTSIFRAEVKRLCVVLRALRSPTFVRRIMHPAKGLILFFRPF
jgi:hypothetical protein